MKRTLPLLLLCMMIVFCGGCGSSVDDDLLLVYIMDTEGVTVAENGLYVSAGSDAVFALKIPTDYALKSTDYAGEYRITEAGGTVTLTLFDVQYPTGVRLQLVSKNYTIVYHANGGAGIGDILSETAVSYSLKHHARPNTSIGTDMFQLDGHTLVCWNTEPDGSGTRVGLGSRVTVSQGQPLNLYAQWLPWSDADDFTTISQDGGITITGYHGTDAVVVIPESMDGVPVTQIAAGAFADCSVEEVVLPKTMRYVEPGAFRNCGLKKLTLFDNIESIPDDAFIECSDLQTLYINAIEAPYGYLFRRESVYADKIDMLILAQGKRKMVFYGGCAMWYNLDGPAMQNALGSDYQVINVAINGTVNSLVQMQILEAYMEPGDILFHAPELSSETQLFRVQDMRTQDEHFWCGLEYNYDLFALADLRQFRGTFDSLTYYLAQKNKESSYLDYYRDSDDHVYMDATGSVPFFREQTHNDLGDEVFLDPGYIGKENMDDLQAQYDALQAKGVRIYVSYACVNMDAVPEVQRGNVEQMDAVFHSAIQDMNGPVLISRLGDFLFRQYDFYDTNYHLLTEQASQNTAVWIRDLMAQLEKDGLWKVEP